MGDTPPLAPPDDEVPWGPKLYDPKNPEAGLEPLPGLSKGLPGAHPAVQWSFHQIVRTKGGGLLAMGGKLPPNHLCPLVPHG